MRTLLLFIFISVSLLVSKSLQAQNAKTIVRLQEAEQACLDSGVYMLGCAKKFYLQMDSLLNVVYLQLRSTLNSAQKDSLRKQQRLWLIKRDAFSLRPFLRAWSNHYL